MLELGFALIVLLLGWAGGEIDIGWAQILGGDGIDIGRGGGGGSFGSPLVAVAGFGRVPIG